MSVVRELIALLGFEIDDAGIARANAGFGALQAAAAGIVGAAAGAAYSLFAVIESAAELGDVAVNSAMKLGMTAEEFQEWNFIAGQAGTDIGSVANAMRILQQRQAEAAGGNKAFAASFAKAGVKIRGSNGELKDSGVLFDEVLDKLAGVENQSERTALAVRLFGRAGTGLIPLASEGADSLRQMREEARALGFIMSDEAAAAAEEFGDQVGLVTWGLRGMANELGSELIPYARVAVVTIKQWLIANREFISRGIKEFAKWVGNAARRAVAFADALITVIKWIDKASGALTALAAVYIARAVAVIGQMTIAWLKAGAAMNWATIRLVLLELAFFAFAAVIGLVIEDLYNWANGAPSLIGRVIKHFVDRPIQENDHWIIKTIGYIVQAFHWLDRTIKRFVDIAADEGLAKAMADLFKPITDALDGLSRRFNEWLESFVPDWMRRVGDKILKWRYAVGFDLPPPPRRIEPAPLRSGSGGAVGFPSNTPFPGQPAVTPGPWLNPLVPDVSPSPLRSGGGAMIFQGGPSYVNVTTPPGSDVEEYKRAVADAVHEANKREIRLAFEQLQNTGGQVY